MYRFARILLFISIGSFAQTSPVQKFQKELNNQIVDSSFVEAVIKETSQFRNMGEFETALNLINWLEEKVNTKDSILLFGKILSEKAEIQFRYGAYNDALITSKKSLYNFKKINNEPNIAATLNQIGSVHYRLNNMDSTSYYYEKSYAYKKKINADPWQLAISAYNIALVLNKQGKFDETLTYYFKAIEWYHKSDSKAVFLPSVYGSISVIYKNKNDFVKALEYTSLSLTEGERLHGENDMRLMIIYNHAASLYISMEDEEMAKSLLMKSLSIAKNKYGDNHYWTATVYGGLAKTMLNLKKVDSAKWAINKAIKIGKKLEASFDFGDLYHIQSEILQEEKSFEAALLAIKESRNYYLKNYSPLHYKIASTWLQEAKIYKEINEIAEYKTALSNTLSNSNYNPEDLAGLTAPFVVMEALQLEFQLGEEKLKMKFVDAQIDLIKHIKKFYNTNEAKLFFNATASSIIKDDINYCYSQFEKTNDTLFLEKAFELVQLHHNSILAEELQSFKQSNFTKESIQADSLVKSKQKEWAQTKEELYHEQNLKAPNQLLIDSLINRRVYVSRALDQAISDLAVFTRNTAKQIEVVSIMQVQKNLPDNSQVLQYFVGNKYIYVFSITAEGVNFLKLAETKSTEHIIEKIRTSITERRPFEGLDKKLHQDLMAPILENSKNRLIILPEGTLSYIPFELLKDRDDLLLISQKTISYQAAVSLLLMDSPRPNNSNFWSGFACNYSGLGELPKSIEEVNTIQRITSGASFLNENVTQESLFKNAATSSILHLALHGITNPYNALYSELLLNDESVTASEIYNEQVNADLVVLSACETGYGTIQKGEGIMSLSRAFTYAGAKSTLTSLWKVPDQETAQIMVSFYVHLMKGQHKDEALQNAKLDYLKNTDDALLKHPYYWSGFVITGDNNPIQTNTPFYYYLILGLLIALMLVALFVSYKNRSKKLP